MQHYPFPSIEQFRSVVKQVKDTAAHHSKVPSVLTFYGTIKLHGTNAGVVVSNNQYYPQSRSQVLSHENDNAGFANFALQLDTKDAIKRFAEALDSQGVVVYGEWCGGNIQKGVALNGLPKMFVIFAAKKIVSDAWATASQLKAAFACVGAGYRIYYIGDFPTYSIDIDMANPASAQNKLISLTEQVEQECPVGKAFGVCGIGEGIVWSTESYRFKVKGEKHSDSKIRTLAPVDIEKLESIKELAESFVTEHRLEKGIIYCSITDYKIKDIGAFLKWVSTDVIKEESDTILGNGFEVKEVIKVVSHLSRNWYLEKLA